MKNENNLTSLLQNNASAKEFFLTLPDYVQGAVEKNATNISSESELKDCARSVFKELL